MNRRIKAIHILVVLSLVGILAMTGCGSSGGYKSITVESELCHYSLEYPACYDKEIWNDFDFKVPYTQFILDAPAIYEEGEIPNLQSGEVETVTGRRSPAAIYVVVSDSKKYWGESYSATDKLEAMLEGVSDWDDYELLERAPLTVAGIEGEMVAYFTYSAIAWLTGGEGLEYYLEVYFDYNGLIWSIRAQCDEAVMEQIKADFEHIVETFTILD